MALQKQSWLQRLVSSRTRASRVGPRDLQRLQEKERALARTADQWRTLLRDMEHTGQSGEARYGSYYQAYLKARQQQKEAELELFNVRQKLTF